MSIERDLYDALRSHAGLAALVGTRIYPVRFSQEAAFPLVTYQRISTPRNQAMDGSVAGAHARFQVTCWAESALTAQQVAAEARAAVLAMTGGTVPLYEVVLVDQGEDFHPEAQLYQQRVDVVLVHGE